MKIAVFGLGYVGCVSAACFCDLGHEVWGIDIDPGKVDYIRRGQSPIIERDLDTLIHKYVQWGRLHACDLADEAIAQTELSLVCVGTPSLNTGAPNVEFVKRVSEEIGRAIRKVSHHHTVVIRSTLLPGTTRKELLPRLEEYSGSREGDRFSLAYNPEFLREGSAIKDFYDPPKTVVGACREEAARTAGAIYENIKAPLFYTTIEEAEIIKFADNVFHAVKIVFANEIGAVAKPLGIDSHRVMEIFTSDVKLNLSPYYLKPGFAFGGSCLPKDVRALAWCAQHMNVKVPMIHAVMESNREHVHRAFREISAFGKKTIGVLGLAFKSETDDLRESPTVELVETLLGKGYQIKIYDRNVSLARLIGSNKAYIEKTIPHLAELLVREIDEVMQHGELIVVANPEREFVEALQRARPEQVIYDLVRIVPEQVRSQSNYHGICW